MPEPLRPLPTPNFGYSVFTAEGDRVPVCGYAETQAVVIGDLVLDIGEARRLAVRLLMSIADAEGTEQS